MRNLTNTELANITGGFAGLNLTGYYNAPQTLTNAASLKPVASPTPLRVIRSAGSPWISHRQMH